MAPDRPLEGRTVVVTRPREQAALLVEVLENLGAEVLLAPTIRIVPRALDDEIVRVVVSDLPDYRLLIFTSVNGVDAFLGYIAELGLPLASLDDAVVAAVGPKTASALEARGVACDVVAGDFVAEGLLDTLEKRAVTLAGARVLIPSARLARTVIPDALRASGAFVTVLPVYDTVPEEHLRVPAARVESAGYITFTSSSTVRQFVALMEAAGARGGPRGAARPLVERLAGARLCSIGPVTSETLRELGLAVAVEAREFTAAGLAAAIARDARDG